MRIRRSALAILLLSLAWPPAASAQRAPRGTDIYLAAFTTQNGRLRLGTPQNITDRDGYDNQPLFDPDVTGIFYTSYRFGQSDTYWYSIRSGRTARMTETPESEYSPTVMPGRPSFSVVRVEADSTQRLWQFDQYGLNPKVILEDVQPVGYYAWVNRQTVALFILGSPPTLQLTDIKTGRTELIAENIGRSIHKIPGREAISFVQVESETSAWIKELDLSIGEVTRLIRLLEGNEFYAWTPDGHLIMGQESKLYRWRRGTDASWQEIADLRAAGISNISRVAVSGDGRYIAIVGVRW